jgi:hypothetical protein
MGVECECRNHQLVRGLTEADVVFDTIDTQSESQPAVESASPPTPKGQLSAIARLTTSRLGANPLAPTKFSRKFQIARRARAATALAPRWGARTRNGYRVQDTPAGAPVGAPIHADGDASF